MQNLVEKGQLLMALSCTLKRAKIKSTLGHPEVSLPWDTLFPARGRARKLRGSHLRLNKNWKNLSDARGCPRMGIRGAEGELLVGFELRWEVWLMYLCSSNNTKIPMN